jgi:hypothetical protein
VTIDYSAMLFDPVFAELGVPAVFTVVGADTGVDITVIDDTVPKMLPTGSNAGAEVQSVRPGAVVRVPELTAKGIARADYGDAVLAFNGRSWISGKCGSR